MTDTASADRTAPLDALHAHLRRGFLLEQAAGILGWDQQTMMPDGAGPARGETLAELAAMAHEIWLDPALDDLIGAAEATAPEDPFARANIAEIKHGRRRALALPADLVAARSRAASACEMVWRTARADSDFAALRPSWETVLRLEREAAAALAEALDLGRYDALLDGFEPFGRIGSIEPLFDDLAEFLPPLRDAALDAPKPSPTPAGPFPIAAQEQLGRRLMRALGFDFNRGRLDMSLHPFCGGAIDDVRITTRYDEADFTSALMGVMHETGHALYELGLPRAWREQPVGAARGMTLHESQSLLIEMQVCRSADFFAFAAPLFAEAFDADPDDPEWSGERFAAAAIRVEPGFIRVDADELSYPLHVILRTRLERAMIEGRLEIADLPGAWNDGFEDLLGQRPPNDRLGCLQDIHWPSGAFGYFPTYTLGAMAAAQIFAAARRALPTLGQEIRAGRFEPLVAWLGREIHGRGSLGSTDDILSAATGAPLSADAFKAHLTARYAP